MIRSQSAAVQPRSSRLKAMIGLLRIDRAHLQHVGFAAQAVEQLHHALAIAHHVGLRRAGIVEIGQRDVAHALAAVLLLRSRSSAMAVTMASSSIGLRPVQAATAHLRRGS